ncbi:methyltransferase [Aestuariicella hydrocarbonica]|uniref:Methyltransferase n=1 Tax=Pseudomaricurvus hydrocarbonicus TaxID=1470433 RepID=A0A9E5MHP8_9GAMM|nr:methyltransferase [Aestuariicella hydrocarbonica]NHO66216.1 methyltransferase [Aestuariicella hydrocarbonica]
MLELPSYQAWFAELDALLVAHRPWWQFRPFHQQSMPWEASHPELARALLALTDDQLRALDAAPEVLATWLQPWISGGKRLLELCQLPASPQRGLEIPQRLEVSVPGRKWQQACHFVAARPASARPLLEWCSGKGHLGRLLASVDGCAVTSFEWQQSLCDAGTLLAQRLGIGQTFACGDAFAPQSGQWLARDGQAVALHACGDLHVTLMQHWVAQRGHSLTVSPCCYHLIRTPQYQPLSSSAQASELQLERSDLSLPLQETVTAGEGDRRRREQELLWRLSFDEWQRELRGVDRYLPAPALPRRYLSGTFTEFCKAVMAHHQLDWPGGAVADHWLQRGQQRLALVTRMELIAHLFRRPLEIWLALDRVLFLQDSGATVTLSEFCERALTPRNLMIHAER